jgi:hypothetical protein
MHYKCIGQETQTMNAAQFQTLIGMRMQGAIHFAPAMP